MLKLFYIVKNILYCNIIIFCCVCFLLQCVLQVCCIAYFCNADNAVNYTILFRVDQFPILKMFNAKLTLIHKYQFIDQHSPCHQHCRRSPSQPHLCLIHCLAGGDLPVPEAVSRARVPEAVSRALPVGLRAPQTPGSERRQGGADYVFVRRCCRLLGRDLCFRPPESESVALATSDAGRRRGRSPWE